MTKAWLRWASALIPAITSSLTTAYLLVSSNWEQWGGFEMERMTPSTTSFADLANITLTADCINRGLALEDCDPYGRPFQPYVVLPARVLAFLGMGLNQTGIPGTVLALTTVAVVIGLALLIAARWQRGPAGLIAVQMALALSAVSPGVILGMERGQIEQMTLALVTIALLVLGSRKPIKWLGTFVSVLATAIKYLTVGMFLAFANKDALRQRPWAVITAVAASGAWLLASLPEIMQAAETGDSAVPQTTMSAFGLTTTVATPLSGSPLFYYPPENIAEMWPTLRIIGFIAFAAASGLAYLIVRRIALPDTSSSAWTLTVGSGGVLLLPYVIGSSNDYRLIFLIPLLAGAALWWGTSPDRPVLPAFLVLTSTIALVTSASMVPTPQDWRWPTWFVITGDIGLFCILALTAALATVGLIGRARSSSSSAESPEAMQVR